ncbi:hypothetical protein E1B28_010874 [Marasmius oreades]|uniref:Uncharacterized protein n=1 Tax=Marasmius oreades TaxID=181124 RepID=A0A9P7RTN2_9AGAR|nr:uncharacterized protein E1B28_010874 [Marasmius oreades]KAG7089170.1 hypothetical protein E1B28_010874 [Marasmius oreades]
MPIFRRETSVSVATEDVSAANGDNGGLVTRFLVLGGLVLAAVIATKKWFYPYTIGDLESQVKSIDMLITDNMSLKWNLLGDSAPSFRRKLERVNDEVRLVKTNMYAEPDKAKIVVWMGYQWSQLRDIKACYMRLRELQLDVTVGGHDPELR